MKASARLLALYAVAAAMACEPMVSPPVQRSPIPPKRGGSFKANRRRQVAKRKGR